MWPKLQTSPNVPFCGGSPTPPLKWDRPRSAQSPRGSWGLTWKDLPSKQRRGFHHNASEDPQVSSTMSPFPRIWKTYQLQLASFPPLKVNHRSKSIDPEQLQTPHTTACYAKSILVTCPDPATSAERLQFLSIWNTLVATFADSCSPNKDAVVDDGYGLGLSQHTAACLI